jgi:hypothetical protein
LSELISLIFFFIFSDKAPIVRKAAGGESGERRAKESEKSVKSQKKTLPS